MRKKLNFKKLILTIAIPLILGLIVGLISKNHDWYFKPKLTPPDIVFPIVWTILYILLGLSYYLIPIKTEKVKKRYIINLAINLLWPIIFFNFQWFLVAFLWIILLDISLILMMAEFYKENKTSFYLNIPYLLWSLFATYLTFETFLLNR